MPGQAYCMVPQIPKKVTNSKLLCDHILSNPSKLRVIARIARESITFSVSTD